jgi:hypothetical protein
VKTKPAPRTLAAVKKQRQAKRRKKRAYRPATAGTLTRKRLGIPRDPKAAVKRHLKKQLAAFFEKETNR